MRKIIAYILATLFISISVAQVALAIGPTPTSNEEKVFKQSVIPKPTYLPGPKETDQTEAKKIFGTKVLPNLAVMLIGFTGGLALLFLVIAGVRFVTAYGNDESVENAKKQAIFAIGGFALAVFSYAIVAIITNIKFVDDTTVRTGITGEETAGNTDNIIDSGTNTPNTDNIIDKKPDEPKPDRSNVKN